MCENCADVPNSRRFRRALHLLLRPGVAVGEAARGLRGLRRSNHPNRRSCSPVCRILFSLRLRPRIPEKMPRFPRTNKT